MFVPNVPYIELFCCIFRLFCNFCICVKPQYRTWPESRTEGEGMLKSESPCKKNKRLQLVLLCLNKANVHCAHTSKGTTNQTKQNIGCAHFYQFKCSTFYVKCCVYHPHLATLAPFQYSAFPVFSGPRGRLHFLFAYLSFPPGGVSHIQLHKAQQPMVEMNHS